jgi:hypothetical protein
MNCGAGIPDFDAWRAGAVYVVDGHDLSNTNISEESQLLKGAASRIFVWRQTCC